MKKILILFLPIILFFACSETHEQSDFKDQTEEQDFSNVSFEERVKLHVQSQLGIPGNEKYGLEIYKENLTEDGIEDAIITVNRLEYAINKSKAENKLAKASEVDFWGEYNIIFYYDSELDKITPPMPITSSPTKSLRVNFENISSETYKDVIIDYPIRNSEFRIYLAIIDHAPSNTFQWKLFDGWGTDEVESYCFSYDKGSYTNVKDILINKGKIKNISKNDDYNKITPEITCTEEEVHRFFFNPKDRKYYTKNK